MQPRSLTKPLPRRWMFIQKKRNQKSTVILCILAVLVAACTARPPSTVLPTTQFANDLSTLQPRTSTPANYWPTQDWRTATPESQGLDSSRLASMLEWIQQQGLNLHSLLIIRKGYIVSETYFGAYHQKDSHQLYSCTKSYIATLIGIALDRGEIQGVDQAVMDFFAGREFANPGAQKEAMSLEDLLTMRSGLDWQESDPAIGEMIMSPDWVKYVLDKPMIQTPGTQFNYCSGCSHVLSAILQQATGMSTRDYAEQNLFEPLGITNVRWESDPAGTPGGGWGLNLTPRDMAKLGYLYLHDGSWDGQQIVSSGWVRAATQDHTITDGELGYGYQWWVYPSYGAYVALGHLGQTIFVAPEADLIVVTTANVGDHAQIFQMIDEYIMPSIISN